MRAAHMAEEQICEPCSKLDLSVHPHTDKQAEWWSKRAVILLHGCVDALVPPLLLLPPFGWCLLLHLDEHVGYRVSHPSNARLQNTPSTCSLCTMSCLDWPLPITRHLCGNTVCGLVLMHNLWFVFMPQTTLCCTPGHMFMLLREDCKRTCGNMLQ